MGNLTTFNFGDVSNIRVIEKNGEAWFVASDIAKALDYRDASNMNRNLDDDEKMISSVITRGGLQKMLVISETGLYRLVLSSRRKKAELVARRIFSDIADSKAVIRALQEFEVPDDLPDMYVYAIREKETGRIKIGISRDPESRLKQLQTGNSQQLELIAYRKAENRYKDEARLHRMFSDYHVRGEWFSGEISASDHAPTEHYFGTVM